MKTAEEWQNELAGETSVESYRRIQSDAIYAAALIIAKERTVGAAVDRLLFEASTIESAANELEGK